MEGRSQFNQLQRSIRYLKVILYIASSLIFLQAFDAEGMSVANLLLNSSPLRHKYWVLRHGNSLANQMKIISSDPEVSTVEHGLSELGHEQARNAAIDFKDFYLRESQVHFHPTCFNHQIPTIINLNNLSLLNL